MDLSHLGQSFCCLSEWCLLHSLFALYVGLFIYMYAYMYINNIYIYIYIRKEPSIIGIVLSCDI